MWLATQIGFFSVVRKAANEYHIRARVRRDLENLKGMMAVDLGARLPEIQEWPDADYRWRIIVTSDGWGLIGCALVGGVDYSNFKSRIASLDDQQDKLGDYSELHHAGEQWQADDVECRLADAVDDLVFASVDDFKSHLTHTTKASLRLLDAALTKCSREGMKTKAVLIERHIKQLER